MIFSNLFLLSGIMIPPIFPEWRKSPFIKELNHIFETMHETYQGSCISAVGVLYLNDKDVLCPKFIMKIGDDSFQEVSVEDHVISLSDLITDEETIKELRENGFLIISKFADE